MRRMIERHPDAESMELPNRDAFTDEQEVDLDTSIDLMRAVKRRANLGSNAEQFVAAALMRTGFDTDLTQSVLFGTRKFGSLPAVRQLVTGFVESVRADLA